MQNDTIELEDIEAVEQSLSTKDENIQTQETKEAMDEDETIVVTPNQQDIVKQIAKIDVQLEELEKSTINEDEFYNSLDDVLSEEEKYLQDENIKEYLKIVDKKRKEFIKSKSNDSLKFELEQKKKDLELENAIEDGRIKVSKLYKDYNHEAMENFYRQKLTQEEKDEILQSAKTTYDVFKKTYEKYLEKTGSQIELKSTKAPNIPNLKNIVKQSIKNQIDEIDSEDERYKKALGV